MEKELIGVIIDCYGTKVFVIPEVNHYQNNKNLAIQLHGMEKGSDYFEPFSILTVNLNEPLANNKAYVDTNNNPWSEDYIKKMGIGVPTGDYGASGYCTYPLYKFDLNKLEEINKHNLKVLSDKGMI